MEKLFFIKIVVLIFLTFFINSCSEEDNTLAPYAGSPKLSQVTIEAASFKPKVTWSGGYASVFGINRGSNAALDSSLVWLVYSSGNKIEYPLQFGELPAGAQDLTAQYGGQNTDSLSEDEMYTFWILKEDVWNQVSTQSGAKLHVDSTAQASSVIISSDSISISQYSFISEIQNLDVFINISNVVAFGRVGTISVNAINRNVPEIIWETESSVTDPLISAIGLVEGNQYQASNILWEVYSERDSSGTLIYGKDNIISQPVIVGESFPNAKTFVEFTLEGLERKKTYYIWIANKSWDRVSRSRFANGYAYATFDVN